MFIAKVYFETNTKEKFKKGQEVPAEIAAKYPIRVEEVSKVAKEVEVIEKIEEPKEELLIETPVEVETEVEVIEEPKKKGKKRK